MESLDTPLSVSLAAGGTAAHPDAPEIVDTLFAPNGIAAAMSLAMVAWDAEMRIVGWNKAAECLFGWSAQETLGRPAIELLPEDMHGKIPEITRQLHADELPAYDINLHTTRDGRRIVCGWDCIPLKNPDGSLLAAVFLGRDVTRQRQEIRERERILAIAAAANTAHDLDEILLILRNAIIEIEGFDRAGVWLIENGILYGTWGTDEAGQLRDEHDICGTPEEFPIGMEKVARGVHPYYLESETLINYPRLGQVNIEVKRDYAVVGMYTQGELIGLICVDNLLSARRISEADVQVLLPFSEQAAVVIANARLREERERRAERNRRLMEIASAINASLELDKILRLVRDALIEEGGFDRAGIFLVENNKVHGAWGTDMQGRVRDEHHLLDPLEGSSPHIERMQSGRLTHFIGQERLGEPGYGDILVTSAIIALRAGGELVGLLCMDNAISGRPLVEENVASMLEFAEQTAIAVRNARLLEERQRHLDRQRRLASLAAAISASMALNDILRMMRDAVTEVGGFDRAAVYLYDRETHRLQGTWGTERQGQPIDESDFFFYLEEADDAPFITPVVHGEQPYALTADYAAMYGLPIGHPMYGVRAHAAVSLRVGSDVVGVVFVDNLIRDTPITEEDIEGLLPFAEQAAVAIQNARLFAELRQVQEALVRSEKMRAVGELASGVAHNVNNVLAAVLGYTELIQDAASVPAEVRRYAQTIERAALDGAAIVRRVQRFAYRKNETGLATFDLATVAGEAIEMTRPAWHNQATGRGVKIEVKTGLQTGLTVRGEASEIREVLVNLIRNAVDAMPDGGALTILCHAEESDGIVAVTDTGIGMDEQTCRRIFEPFFTTKSAGLGIGLGLSVAWGIMDRHKGRIEVQSAPGEGSLFRVCLPLADEIEAPGTLAGATRRLEGIHILLVEDEEIVAEGLAQVLEARGAEVDRARDASGALEWLRDHATQCDIVISDHGMVGMTGMELLASIRERYPGLRRILLSGWGANLPDEADTSAADQVLTKPVGMDALAATIAELIRR
jgi:PAS domain S-box-containing protein